MFKIGDRVKVVGLEELLGIKKYYEQNVVWGKGYCGITEDMYTYSGVEGVITYCNYEANTYMVDKIDWFWNSNMLEMVEEGYKKMYDVDDIVECVSLSKDNVEDLTIGNLYVVVGYTLEDGNLVYTVKDSSGKLHFSMNNFRPTNVESFFESIGEDEYFQLELDDETEVLPDMVNHPPHYCIGGLETIKIIEMSLTPEEFRGYLKGNVLKYRERAEHKGNAEQDYAKSVYYYNLYCEKMEDI